MKHPLETEIIKLSTNISAEEMTKSFDKLKENDEVSRLEVIDTFNGDHLFTGTVDYIIQKLEKVRSHYKEKGVDNIIINVDSGLNSLTVDILNTKVNN